MAPTPEQAREAGKRGGRPKGSNGALAKITEYKARELAAKQETPLDVMIDNMNYWRRKAANLTAEGDDLELVLKQFANVQVSEKSMARFMDLMEKRNKINEAMLSARSHSQSCAVDAAPYVHPRLQAIAVQQGIGETKIIRLAITNPGGGALTFDAEAIKPTQEPAEVRAEPIDEPVVESELLEPEAGTGTDG